MAADTATETTVSTGDQEVEPATTAPPDDQDQDRLLPRLAWATCLAVLVPLVVAAVRAINAGWVPVGDSALIAVRSRDVLGGGELPLIGMWSSSSWVLGFDFNHPGPLLYDLLAVPAALFPGGAGQVLGATLVEGASVVGIFLLARRRGGAPLAIAAMAVTAGLCWSMGSAVLVEPWHANTVLLPFLCFVMLAWSVGCGDRVCLPWALAIGSLLIQTNLAYGVFVPALLVAGVIGWHVAVRQRDDDPSPRTVWLLTVVVFAACWAQPVAEQLFGQGAGNLSLVLRSLGDAPGTLNWHRAFRAVADVVALPPWWGRPSFAEAFPFGAFGNPLPALSVALVGLAVLVGLLIWGLRDAWRRGDAVAAAALATGLLLLALSVLAANLTPTIVNFGTVAYQLRWLWPVAGFLWFALIGWLLRRYAFEGMARRWSAVALAAATAALAVLALFPATGGTNAPASSLSVARRLVREVAAADLTGPLLVDCDEGTYDPYCESVMFELQRRDIPFVVRDDVEIRQLGEQRRWDGDAATGLLRVVAGDFAVLRPADAEQVTLLEGLDETDRLELFYLQQEIRTGPDGGFQLNDRGRQVAARGDLPSVHGEGTSARIDREEVLAAREFPFGEHRRDLVAMVREDLLDIDPAWTDRLERYAELQEAWDTETVGVYLQPIEAA
jgi:hypothetical protein